MRLQGTDIRDPASHMLQITRNISDSIIGEIPVFKNLKGIQFKNKYMRSNAKLGNPGIASNYTGNVNLTFRQSSSPLASSTHHEVSLVMLLSVRSGPRLHHATDQ